MRTSTPILFIAIAMLAYSCSTVFTTRIDGTAPPPMPDTANFILLNESDTTAIPGNRIGELTLRHSPTWIRYQLEDSIRSISLRNGANLAKVTAYVRPGRNRTGQLAADIYQVQELRQYEKVIDWNTNRQLTFTDFKGAADTATGVPLENHSRVYFTIDEDPRGFRTSLFSTKTRFDCTTSRINSQPKNAPELLLHEQGNFDLCEIYRRQLDQFILKYDYNHFNQHRIVAEIFEGVSTAFLVKQAQYESATNHGLDYVQQSEWTKQIDNALRYGDTAFAVPEVFTIPQEETWPKRLHLCPAKPWSI